MQVWLRDTTKANNREAGANVKEHGLLSGASHLEDGGLTSQSPAPGKMGDSCLEAHLPGRWGAHLKAHLHLSVEAEVFIRRERGTEQRDQGRGLQSPLRAD